MNRGCGTASGSPHSALTRRSLLTGAGGVSVSASLLKAAPAGSKAHVAVIGAGVFGTWTAHHLLAAGHRVTLIDAWGPAHARASSGGESRMTRAAYGKDLIYSRMALDSLVQWKALSGLSGLPIFTPCGVLFFFPREEAYLVDSLAAHAKLGIPSQALGKAEMTKRFPMIDFVGVSAAIYEPGFGALMARRAVQTLAMRFVKDGGHYVSGFVQPPATRERNLREITLNSGQKIAADRFVFAAGPWLPKLFPEIIGDRIQPTRQEIFFFAPPAGDPMFQAGRMPGWADFNGGDVYYGFPDLEARGVKFANDSHGVDVDPDTQSRRPTETALAEVIAYRDRRFPALRGAQLTESRVCQYENSSNGDFLIDRHPSMSNVVVVGGGSGHGFKHGPEVGRLAAKLALTSRAQPEPRFSLATKATTHRREVI